MSDNSVWAFPRDTGGWSTGLTKREWFAGLAMQAWRLKDTGRPSDILAAYAFQDADAMLDEAKKRNNPKKIKRKNKKRNVK